MSPFASWRGRIRRLVHGAPSVGWHPAFRLPMAGLESTTGMDPRRGENVLIWLLDRGIVGPADLFEATEAPWTWAAAVHGPEYLASLDRPEVIANIVGVDASRVATDAMLETWRRAVGGAVEAAERAAHGARVASLLGGFHHAAPDRGAGFCGLNDVAIAIHRLRAGGFSGEITVYDLDAHPPDGLAACVAADPRVHVVSIGVASSWELLGEVLDIRVPAKSEDAAYLVGVDRLLREAPRADLAFVLAGADPLAGDRFGGLACTEAGLYERDRRVLSHLSGVPVVLLPAGGYTRDAWRVFAHAVALLAGSSQRVRTRYDPLLRRSRDVARTLDPKALGDDDAADWADLAAELRLAPRGEPRVLGFYTRQGIEYGLERYGILPALRRMGFAGLELEVTADRMPHRMRALAMVDGKKQPLIELAVSIRNVGEWRTLFVEWLSLRDPRAEFTSERPRLPGQERPGLGIAEEFGQVLVRMADRLGLAGVSFVPAHYHVAWMVHRRFSFADVAFAGAFEAMQRALIGVPLPEASRRLDEEGLPVEWGDPVRWRPEVMVRPSDPALSAWLAERQPLVEAACGKVLDRLIPL